MGSFSIWHWVIVLVIVMLVFGTKKLGNIGGDLGKAVKGLKDGVKGGEEEQPTAPAAQRPYRASRVRSLTSKHAKKPRAKSACLCNGRGDRDRLMCYFLSFHPHD